jgi:hypothetical protein
MSFVEDLQNLINKHSLEQYSDTPDFLLAEFLKGCLTAYESTVKKRDKWYHIECKCRYGNSESRTLSEHL